jgi:acetyltransferase-like isoleucine patch superfamily enzyme
MKNFIIGKNSKIDKFCIVGYKPKNYITDSRLVIGNDCTIRSHTVIYYGNKIGNNLTTGHHVLIREKNSIGDNVSIGSNSVIEHHVIIGNNVRIHSNCFIPEFTIIEDDVWIGPGVVFTNARYPAGRNTKKFLMGCKISQFAKIGAGCVILPGVQIGKNSLIGAGSVVTKDVADGIVSVGNPAVKINQTKNLKFPDNTFVYK